MAAEKLFNEAVVLMKKGDFDKAARKLEASQEYDPAFATAMNLAACYEKLGKLASAWARYREAADMAAESGDTEPRNEASRRAQMLEKSLPSLVIKVAEANRDIPGLTITRDDREVVSSAFEAAIYVDPGEYEIKAAAPSHEPFSRRVVARIGESVTVEIPKLQAIANVTPPSDDGRKKPRKPGTGGTRRILGWAGIGTGVAVSAVGVAFGLSAISTWNNAIDSGMCDESTLECSRDGQRETDKARFRATVSDVMVVAGLALAATGTWLVWTAPEPDRATQIVPAVGPESVSIVLEGRF